MRRWGGLVAVAVAFACQQGGGPDGGGRNILTDGGPTDGGPPDGGPPDAGPPTHPKWPPPRPNYVNPIPGENQKAGDPSWNRGFTRPNSGQLAAYADRVSAKAGQTVNLMVNAAARGCGANWTLYRVGWYGGAGARAMASGSSPINPQPACPTDPITGLVRCSWSPTSSVQIPPDAVSGLYLVRVIDDRDLYRHALAKKEA